MAASGGLFPWARSKGPGDIHDFCCTPCFHGEGIISAARKLCLECGEYYCAQCVDAHKNDFVTSGHKLLDRKKMGKLPQPPTPTQMCRGHDGQRLAVYCSQHDVVLCHIGVSESHETCDGMAYIEAVATGIKSSKHIQITKARINSTLKVVKGHKDLRQSDLADLERDNEANIYQVQRLTERLITSIRDMEKTTKDAMNFKHKQQSDEIGKQLASLDDMIATMERDLQKLNRLEDNPDSQIFMDVKLGHLHETEGNQLLDQLPRLGIPSLKSVLQDYLSKFAHVQASLVNRFTKESRMYEAVHSANYNARMKTDTIMCDIGGVCMLPDRTVLITDYFNRSLKRIYDSDTVSDHCNLATNPWAVTCTAHNEVAVTLHKQKKVQFITVTRESMSPSRSFNTSDVCRGIMFSDEKLYVACGGSTRKGQDEGPGHVAIYSLDGVQKIKVQTETTGQNVLSCPKHISVSSDGDKLYVAQNTTDTINTSVIVLDRDGTLVGSISDPSLKHASGLCALDNGHILVCDRESNSVLQFDDNGLKVRNVLRNPDNVKEPQSLCYYKKTSSLIVTMYSNDVIKVFDLMDKMFLAFIAILLLGQTDALTCLRCIRARALDECTTSVPCAANEVCYMDEIVTTEKSIEYDGGCRPRDVCRSTSTLKSVVGKRALDTVVCSQCCAIERNTNGECNARLCGLRPGATNTTLCYHCEGTNSVDDPNMCSDLTTCQTDQFCTLITQEALKRIDECRTPGNADLCGSVGRKKRQGLGTKICTSCCGDAMCNSDSCEDSLERLYNLWKAGVLDFSTLKVNGRIPTTTW